MSQISEELRSRMVDSYLAPDQQRQESNYDRFRRKIPEIFRSAKQDQIETILNEAVNVLIRTIKNQVNDDNAITDSRCVNIIRDMYDHPSIGKPSLAQAEKLKTFLRELEFTNSLRELGKHLPAEPPASQQEDTSSMSKPGRPGV